MLSNWFSASLDADVSIALDAIQDVMKTLQITDTKYDFKDLFFNTTCDSVFVQGM